MIHFLHTPDRQVLVGGIEDSSNQSSQTSNDDKQSQFPDGKVGCITTKAVLEAEKKGQNWMPLSA